MKRPYLVIADDDTVLGFKCAGIPGVAVEERDQALAALALAREQNVGIVIVTEEVADMMREEMDALRFGAAGDTAPMPVEVPGPQGPLSGRRTLTEVIREAVGIKV